PPRNSHPGQGAAERSPVTAPSPPPPAAPTALPTPSVAPKAPTAATSDPGPQPKPPATPRAREPRTRRAGAAVGGTVEVTPYDAWHLACLFSKEAPGSKGGDLIRVSPPFREIAKRLGEVPEDELDATWDAYLNGLPEDERAALGSAVREANPSGQAPD